MFRKLAFFSELLFSFSRSKQFFNKTVFILKYNVSGFRFFRIIRDSSMIIFATTQLFLRENRNLKKIVSGRFLSKNNIRAASNFGLRNLKFVLTSSFFL